MRKVIMEHYNTIDVSTGERLNYWNELCTNKITRVRVDSSKKDQFKGEMFRLPLRESVLYSAASLAAHVKHRKEDISDYSEQVFKIMLQDEGSSQANINGKEFLLRPGDFTLVDSARPWSLKFADNVRVIIMQFSAKEFLEFVPDAEDLVGQCNNAGNARVDTLSSFLRTMHATSQEGIDESWADILEQVTKELTSTVLSSNLPVGGRSQQQKSQAIRQYIQRNLEDTNLCIASIANHVGITVRTLQLMFARTGTTPTSYILTKRLEFAASKLRKNNSSVTDIAYESGFSDLSHFGRVFRKRYKISPRQYRLNHR